MIMKLFKFPCEKRLLLEIFLLINLIHFSGAFLFSPLCSSAPVQPCPSPCSCSTCCNPNLCGCCSNNCGTQSSCCRSCSSSSSISSISFIEVPQPPIISYIYPSVGGQYPPQQIPEKLMPFSNAIAPFSPSPFSSSTIAPFSSSTIAPFSPLVPTKISTISTAGDDEDSESELTTLKSSTKSTTSKTKGQFLTTIAEEEDYGEITKEASSKTNSKVPKIKQENLDILDDLYDDTIPGPSSNFQVAYVSRESKKLPFFDIFQKRHHYFRELKNRQLRHFSSPSVTNSIKKRKFICNDQKLGNVIAKAIVGDVTISKRLVRKSMEISFFGLKFDIICATGDFSYSIYAKKYCEATRRNITCFAFI